jgi:hypothetical protein
VLELLAGRGGIGRLKGTSMRHTSHLKGRKGAFGFACARFPDFQRQRAFVITSQRELQGELCGGKVRNACAVRCDLAMVVKAMMAVECVGNGMGMAWHGREGLHVKVSLLIHKINLIRGNQVQRDGRLQNNTIQLKDTEWYSTYIRQHELLERQTILHFPSFTALQAKHIPLHRASFLKMPCRPVLIAPYLVSPGRSFEGSVPLSPQTLGPSCCLYSFLRKAFRLQSAHRKPFFLSLVGKFSQKDTRAYRVLYSTFLRVLAPFPSGGSGLFLRAGLATVSASPAVPVFLLSLSWKISCSTVVGPKLPITTKSWIKSKYPLTHSCKAFFWVSATDRRCCTASLSFLPGKRPRSIASAQTTICPVHRIAVTSHSSCSSDM